MRKRSVQEIIEVVDLKDPNRRETAGGAPITSSSNRQERIQKTLSTAEKKIADERNKAQKAKPSIDQQRIDLDKYRSKTDRMKVNLKKKRAAAVEKAEAAKKRSAEKETQSSTVTSRENLRKTIAGGKPSIQKTQGGNKSISDTGTVASNAIKRAASLGRNVAAIPANIAKQKAKAKLGDMQMKDNKAPEGGTARQKIGYATKKSRERVNTAVTNTRRKAGRGLEKVASAGQRVTAAGQRFGKKLANEDFIHEAEKDSSEEVKKKTIDVMKGKNAVEVNPKIQAEETMSPAQKRKDTNLKKKYDDSDMKQNMIDQYGKEEGMKVYYATIRKQAMKTESVLEVQSVSDGLKFREYEFIDVIKNKPMKSPKNNITWTEGRDEYGDPIGGPKISKKQKAKNLASNTPDEQHTTTTSEDISYREFTKKSREAAKKVEQDKQKRREMASASAYKDKKGAGIKFYDKKGAGRIKAGKKIYD